MDGARMTDQELAEMLETSLQRTIRLAREAEARSCGYAEQGLPQAAEVNANVAFALGALLTAKGHLTNAGTAMPDITVQFGGK